jgi:hypothetical protein
MGLCPANHPTVRNPAWPGSSLQPQNNSLNLSEYSIVRAHGTFGVDHDQQNSFYDHPAGSLPPP